MRWVIFEGINEDVDWVIDGESFYKANWLLRSIYTKYKKRPGYEIMNQEHFLGPSKERIPFYDPSRHRQLKDAFATLFSRDYLSELGFHVGSVAELCLFVAGLGGMVFIQVLAMMRC